MSMCKREMTFNDSNRQERQADMSRPHERGKERYIEHIFVLKHNLSDNLKSHSCGNKIRCSVLNREVKTNASNKKNCRELSQPPWSTIFHSYPSGWGWRRTSRRTSSSGSTRSRRVSPWQSCRRSFSEICGFDLESEVTPFCSSPQSALEVAVALTGQGWSRGWREREVGARCA